MFVGSILLVLVALVLFLVAFATKGNRDQGVPTLARYAATGSLVFSLICLAIASAFTVPPSHIAVVTVMGNVQDGKFSEGLHFHYPWAKFNNVFIGTDVAAATKAEAGSSDLQSIYTDITVNYMVKPDKVIDLYRLNPSLQYEAAFVIPAINETFKAVVSKYTAEQLITKRQEVSQVFTKAIDEKLSQYHLDVRDVNIVNFKFSKAFDDAIEEKVTAAQKAETARNNLKRVEFEAQQRIAQAEGEAKAISIQAQAIEKQGGAAYVELKKVEKWDGKLPQYVLGNSVPMLNIGK